MENTDFSRPAWRVLFARHCSRRCEYRGCASVPTALPPAVKCDGAGARYCLFPGPPQCRRKRLPLIIRRMPDFVSSMRPLIGGRNLLHSAEIAVVQGRLAQQSDKDQSAGATPGDKKKSIDQAQAVRLQTNSGSNEINSARPCRRYAGCLRVHSRRHGTNVLIGTPVPTHDVEAKQVRVKFFALSDEVAQVDSACRAAE